MWGISQVSEWQQGAKREKSEWGRFVLTTSWVNQVSFIVSKSRNFQQSTVEVKLSAIYSWGEIVSKFRIEAGTVWLIFLSIFLVVVAIIGTWDFTVIQR